MTAHFPTQLHGVCGARKPSPVTSPGSDSKGRRKFTRRAFALALLAAGAVAGPVVLGGTAQAADPLKIGFGMALTGSLAGNGKAALVAIEMWRDEINAKGGLLGRPVQLVYYDDQTNPALIPGIYTKLLDVDKVDLVISGYGTAVTSAAMPIIMQRKKVFISFFGTAVNDHFNYDKYFQTMPNGPNARIGPSEGFFQAASTMDPKPKTVAIVGAEVESAHNMILGARENAAKYGLKIVFDRGYPPNTVEFGSIVRSIQATNPDVVFVASYPPDSAGMIRAVREERLRTRLFGGGMVGLQFAELKQQLGPMLNDVLCFEFYVPEPTMNFPGVKDFLTRYQKRAKTAGVDPLGFYLPPFAYAGMQILGQAVEATKGLNENAIGQYIHKTTFDTVAGKISFAPNGEWAKSRVLYVQYRGITGNNLEQFNEVGKQVIVEPKELASGTLRYPFSGSGK